MSVRTKHLLAVTAAIVASPLAAVAQAPGATPTPVCRPADELTTRTLNDLRTLVSSTDRTDAALRDSVGLGYQATPVVLLDTVSQHCEQALVNLNAQLQTPGQRRQIYLYRIGDQFGVEDPTHGADSEYRGIRIFGPDWRPRRVLLTY
jgi:hypothetical protein